MAYSLKEQLSKEERFVGGHRLCAGCGAGITVRAVLRALEPEDKAVITNATGCLEVSSFLYPYTAYTDSYIHCAFENAAATCGGVEAAYNVLKRKGKIQDNFKFITFGGDGGTYDIGFQSLSGAMERGHDMVYVCYDNEAYMNTGVQGSSSTPFGASTTTTPAGKPVNNKDLFQICMAHHIPYAATASIANLPDLRRKVQKAKDTKGCRVLHIMSPCPTGWIYKSSKTVEVAREAINCGAWVLVEYENGKVKLGRKPIALGDAGKYIGMQKRFRNVTEEELQSINEHIKEKYAYLEALEKI